MTLYFGRSGALLATAFAALAGGVNSPLLAAPAVQVAPRRREPIVRGGGFGYSLGWTIPGPGWTVAQVKRMAKKRRNQIRHRRACKRKGGSA